MLLQGYGSLILEGTLATIQLALMSMVLAVTLGLIGASAKLSKQPLLRHLAAGYTTLIRSVPDLVIMLLLFFSLQIWLNNLTEWLDTEQIDINPFAAGVLTLGFIYGAYFTETFRGAFQSVPAGQLEAAVAYGMNRRQVFVRVLFPQMMRFALPGIGLKIIQILLTLDMVSDNCLIKILEIVKRWGVLLMHCVILTMLMQ